MLAAVLVSLTCSCEKWLQATSSTQFQADQIFDSRDGFLDALSGVYITMGNESAYGKNATWFLNDVIVYPYDPFSSAALMNLQNHVYTHVEVKKMILSMWQGYYNVIANANMVLDRLESRKDIFSSELEYNLIKGELLAIRAYVHFDILRTFGLPAWGGGNENKVTVPYVLKYGMDVTPQRTYKETQEMLLSDINEALELLADDPVSGVKPDGWDEGPNSEGFWNNRQRHLNLYAVEGLAARVYLWMRDYENAGRYAKMAVEGAVSGGAVSWVDCEQLLTTYDNDRKDWTFSTEHLFSLEITGLYNQTMGYLIPGPSTSEAFHISQTVESLYMGGNYDEEGGSFERDPDIRGMALLLKFNQNAYDCYKLYGSSLFKDNLRNRMPMIKMPEMYYIMAEAALAAEDKTGARECLDIVRLHRGIQDGLPETADLLSNLSREYLREFVNEGQILYWIKRQLGIHGSRAFEWPTSKMVYPEHLILPYPDAEINYGRKQEL